MSTRIFASGKIDKNGMLLLSRIANLKEMYCPYGDTTIVGGSVKYSRCGHWCPHFSEVVKKDKDTIIEICHNIKFVIRSFEDERAS